ncbi:hypothetical protein BDV93DRAFT_524287 [Ceratobasidium sp. AG-I]|nr:hypothetical protein BDV93DRAFT_524287 [Ceratobasidium sp. AG-I]
MSDKEAPWPMSPLSAPYSVEPFSPNSATRMQSNNPTPTYNPHDAFRRDQEWARRDHGKQYVQGSEEYSGPSSFGVGTRLRKPWWMFGFENKSTIPMLIFFGGAILGFSLSRVEMLRFKTLLKMTTPGEGYWYEQSPWKANVIIHIFTHVPASFFSVFCFLPMTYYRWPRFHGILGYIVSILLVISCVCGSVIGRRAQGGDLNMQSAVYMLGSAAAGAVVMGCLEARRGDIAAHREWMLRAWFYNGTFVTTRITVLISAKVITAINTYFSLWQCAEVGYVLKDAGVLALAYPACATPFALANPNDVHVAVHSSLKEGRLGKGSASRASFGMSLWVAMILHMVGIEFYLRLTSATETRRWYDWSREKADARSRIELPHGMSR